MPFKPNAAQEKFVNRLWHRNVILKARQLGFCVSPETRILTADLQWVAIGDIAVGTEVVAVDEHTPGGRGKARRMKTATVQAVRKMQAERFRLTFDDGRTVVCTDRHPWLSRKAGTDAKWRSISGKGNEVAGKLQVGTQVRWIAKPWDQGDYEDGWFGGLLDGEGSIAKSNSSAGINVSQRHGKVWDRVLAYANSRGYNACIENDNKPERDSKFGRTPVPKLAFGRIDEMFRLIGQTRPSRFIGNRFWENRELPGKKTSVGWATITSIESLGVGEVVDMQTSAKTYIAEGFVSHNTTLIAILWLDHALFNADQRCGIIAQDREAAEVIFRDKVKFAYENLPEQIRERFPLGRDSASELLFAHNNSSIRVATSMRSGTIHRLHISEFGKICAKFPDKAKEVMTGSIPAVPSNGILVIESTAEGRDGSFFKICQTAQANFAQRKKLNFRDYRFHFYAWWQEPKYRMDSSMVSISPKQHEYFDEVETIVERDMGITAKIDVDQRAWYVATIEADFEGADDRMWQEYPSCIAGDEFVSTPNGLIRIKDVVPDGDIITHHYHKGIKPVFKIITKLGYSVTCTADHPVKMVDGSFKRMIDGLSIGDVVQLRQPTLSQTEQVINWQPAPFVDGLIKITPKFAEFLGIFMGDGSFYNHTISVACDAQDIDTAEAVEKMFAEFLGGSSSRITGSKKGCLEVRKSNVWFDEPFKLLQLVEHKADGGLKRKVHIPDYIFKSPQPVVCAFLRGLIEADGFVSREGTSIKFFSKHRHVVEQAQLLLLSLGIESRISSLVKKAGNGSTYTGNELVIRANGVRKYAQIVGFISKRKQDRANLSLTKRKTGSCIDFDWTDEIVDIAIIGDREVYDITTATHEFDAGGIVVHNCPAEAFQVSTDGNYYAKDMALLRKRGGITNVPELDMPVNTFWDIGNSDGCAIWFHQDSNGQDRFLDYYEAHGETLKHYVAKLKEKGYVFDTHYLPHDATHERLSDFNKSTLQMLQDLMPGERFVVVPRISYLMDGIQQTRACMRNYYFDQTHCKLGIDRLDGYKKRWNNAESRYVDQPDKSNGCSEGADALRQHAQAKMAGLIVSSTRAAGSDYEEDNDNDWRTI